ncbi:MAG TPA: uracil phosphoribosyltransferase [Acidimicrobiales bacterium]|nr:uracil phosphoribosyltransferase [Acidimicrobiales bacterium]
MASEPAAANARSPAPGPPATSRSVPAGVQLVDHPLAQAMLAALRDRRTPPPLFRLLAKRLALVLCLEATRAVPTAPIEVETPLARAPGARIAKPLVAVPVLRAGLGMLEAVTELFPEVTVGYVGLERDHATFEPSMYYSKLPPLEGAHALLLDPMLATGASACAACDALQKGGAHEITLLSVVSAPEGVRRLRGSHPNVTIVTAAIDEGLNDHAYIVPGLGDFGDRLFGTF